MQGLIPEEPKDFRRMFHFFPSESRLDDMLIKVMGRQIMIGRKQLLFGLGFVVAWATLASSGFGEATALVLMGVIYLVLRFATKPLSGLSRAGATVFAGNSRFASSQ